MKRFLAALGALGAFCLFASGTALLVRHRHQQAAMARFTEAGPASLRREEAAARREGIPLSARDLQAPAPPPARNAAPLYVALTALLKARPLGLPGYAEGMSAAHADTPAQIAAARQALAARRDVMGLVHRAADRPQCVFVRDWSLGAKLEFPELKTEREAARLLQAESYLLARDGHFPEAVADQARGFRVARHAASDPTLTAYLVGEACESITLAGMRSILDLAGPDPRVAEDVRRAVAARPPGPSLRHALAGDTGFACSTFAPMHAAESRGIGAALAAGDFPGAPAAAVPATARQRAGLHALLDAWQADILARMRPVVAASDLPPIPRRAAFQNAEAGSARDGNGPDAPTHLVTGLLLPLFGSADQIDTRAQAQVAVTLAAAALLSARAQTGAFPAAPPGAFTDPFTDQPLIYRRERAGGFVVYSVGPTGHFDGGKPGEKIPSQESLFRFPAVSVPAP